MVKEAAMPSRYVIKHLKRWTENAPSGKPVGSPHSTYREHGGREHEWKG